MPSQNPEQGMLFNVTKPTPIVKRVGERLDPSTRRMILDVGCGLGKNALYLAGLGHAVFGIDSDEKNIDQATASSRQLGLTNCHFEAADVRRKPLSDVKFDIVICTDVLNYMPKTDSIAVLTAMQRATKQGGLNVVSGYLVKPETVRNPRNRDRCLRPGELQRTYAQANWEVLDYQERYENPQYRGDKEHISSKAEIIAQRPWFTR